MRLFRQILECFPATWSFSQILDFANFIWPWGRESMKGNYSILVHREELVGSKVNSVNNLERTWLFPLRVHRRAG